MGRLKEVIESEENISTAFQAYKEIHETWKKIGDIPREKEMKFSVNIREF